MDSILKVLITAVKSKVRKVTTKIKQWTNISFIKSKLLIKVKAFFVKLLDVKPKDKKDYYTVGKWMYSKKLAFSLVVFIGAGSALVFLALQPTSTEDDGALETIQTYKYDSIALRLKEETVNILAEDKHLAYVGQVANGACNGAGKLYRKDGSLVYSGNFINSVFEGSGSAYDTSDSLRYQGEFSENKYHGIGEAYWGNGALQYEGEWERGEKSGDGTLCNISGEAIFTGQFKHDQIVYSQLVQKTTQDIAELHTGDTVIFTGKEQFCVQMPEIEAMYAVDESVITLEDTSPISELYVLQDNLLIGGETYSTILDIKALMGEQLYEGYTFANMGDLVAIDQIHAKGNTTLDKPDITLEMSFEDAFSVVKTQSDYEIYVYAFLHEDIMYRFYTDKQSGEFYFYCID